jgi:hypothetical protein
MWQLKKSGSGEPRSQPVTSPALELVPVTAGYGDDPIVREFSARLQGGTITTVQQIAATGVTVLVVEQNVRDALVMEQGRLFMEGPAAEVRTDPRIRQACLGGNIQQTAA